MNTLEEKVLSKHEIQVLIIMMSKRACFSDFGGSISKEIIDCDMAAANFGPFETNMAITRLLQREMITETSHESNSKYSFTYEAENWLLENEDKLTQNKL